MIVDIHFRNAHIDNSGIRLSTLETLLAMLNAGVHPIIPEKGSLGASGDLAPLAHTVLVMLGEGEAEFQGRNLPGAEAMKAAGIAPVQLAAKEGLALINGTQIMTGIACNVVWDALQLARTADIAAALTAEAQLGIKKPSIRSCTPYAARAARSRRQPISCACLNCL